MYVFQKFKNFLYGLTPSPPPTSAVLIPRCRAGSIPCQKMTGGFDSAETAERHQVLASLAESRHPGLDGETGLLSIGLVSNCLPSRYGVSRTPLRPNILRRSRASFVSFYGRGLAPCRIIRRFPFLTRIFSAKRHLFQGVSTTRGRIIAAFSPSKVRQERQETCYDCLTSPRDFLITNYFVFCSNYDITRHSLHCIAGAPLSLCAATSASFYLLSTTFSPVIRTVFCL